MAMGKAVVVADRGILPELVENKVTGCVVRDTPEGLAQAVLKMVQQPSLREAMGKGAYDKAQRDFRLDCQAEAVEAFYEEMRSLGPLRRSPPPPRSSP